MLLLKITICGNPDLGQDPSRAPYGMKRIKQIQAKDIVEMREKVRNFQEENQLGGGNWKHADLYSNGLSLGRMSYNGRIWGKGGEEVDI